MDITLPNDLTKLIADASAALAQDPQHDLLPKFRWNLQSVFVAKSLDRGHSVSEGLKAWLYVELAAVKHVLPLWEQRRPNDDSPHKLLAEAKRLFIDHLDVKKAEMMAFSFPEDAGSGEPVDYVLSAAICALAFAILIAARPNVISSLNRNSNLNNRQLEFPHDWDASLCASVAYSGDVSLQSNLGKAKRLEFWKWWLSAAVSNAYDKFLAQLN